MTAVLKHIRRCHPFWPREAQPQESSIYIYIYSFVDRAKRCPINLVGFGPERRSPRNLKCIDANSNLRRIQCMRIYLYIYIYANLVGGCVTCDIPTLTCPISILAEAFGFAAASRPGNQKYTKIPNGWIRIQRLHRFMLHASRPHQSLPMSEARLRTVLFLRLGPYSDIDVPDAQGLGPLVPWRTCPGAVPLLPRQPN